MRNIQTFGNSVVPHDAILAFRKIYRRGWKKQLESVLTYTLRCEENTTDVVILKLGIDMEDLWIAERRKE